MCGNKKGEFAVSCCKLSFSGWFLITKSECSQSLCRIFGCADVAKTTGTNVFWRINPLRPSNDESQTSHCNIKGLSVSEVMRIENMITQVQFY